MLGELGQGLYELDHLTIAQVLAGQKGLQEKLEFQRRLAWETARYQAVTIANYAGRSLAKGKHLKPQDFDLFAWEKNESDDVVTAKTKELSIRERLGFPQLN